MNAYELAKELDEYNADGFSVLIVEQSANRLRQQADRIAELEKQVEHYKNKAEYLDKRELELLKQISQLEVYEMQIKKIKNRRDLINLILSDEPLTGWIK